MRFPGVSVQPGPDDAGPASRVPHSQGRAGVVVCRRCQEQLIGSEVEFGVCGDCGGRWRRNLSLRNRGVVA